MKQYLQAFGKGEETLYRESISYREIEKVEY